MECVMCNKKIKELIDKEENLIAVKISLFKIICVDCLGEELWRWVIKNKTRAMVKEWYDTIK